MKRDLFTLPLHLGDELIIDNFAGGGGTSTGLEQAFGRPVDIAINHDPEALAMHAVNHPHTKHLCESVWDVDPIKVTNNQPVGLVWLSPDCKHFSKAKGGKPVEKKIRGLAWVTLRWAAKCKPRVIMLENVEEFKTWGPLIIDADGSARPDPAKKGKTFQSFVRQLEGHGYQVEYNEMRACDYGTPTIRKRFFLVARRDGRRIVWPKPTHGNPKTPAVQAGQLQPWRTAAECIDWNLECPSIFERSKPLAEATLRRIAKGIMRYVINAADPFIVGQGGPIYSGKPVTVHQPFGTLTTENHRAVVVPTLVQTGYGEREGQAPRALDIEKPLGTVVGGASKHALVTAFLSEHANASNQRVMPAEEPLRTICAQVKGGHFSMVSAFLARHYTGVVGADATSPLPTVTAIDHYSLVTTRLEHVHGSDEGSDASDRGASDRGPTGWNDLEAAKHQWPGFGAAAPAGDEDQAGLSGDPRNGGRQELHAVGSSRRLDCAERSDPGRRGHQPSGRNQVQQPPEEFGACDALREFEACVSDRVESGSKSLGGNRGASQGPSTAGPVLQRDRQGAGHFANNGFPGHAKEVVAFLMAYYSTDQDPRLGEPLHTVTTKDRYGLVTIHGQDYQIVDIGLRMLAPRELYRAQGFPDDYVIGDDAGQGLKLSKSAQVRMVGNSVCPPLARALIEANFEHEQQILRSA